MLHGLLLLLYEGFKFSIVYIGGLETRTPKLARGLCGLAGCLLLPRGSVSLTHETSLILILAGLAPSYIDDSDDVIALALRQGANGGAWRSSVAIVVNVCVLREGVFATV